MGYKKCMLIFIKIDGDSIARSALGVSPKKKSNDFTLETQLTLEPDKVETTINSD